MSIGPNEAVIVNTHTGARTKVRLDQPGSVDAGIDRIGSGYIRDDIKRALEARTGGAYRAEGPANPAATAAGRDVLQVAPAGQPAGIGLDTADAGLSALLQRLQQVVKELSRVVQKLAAVLRQDGALPTAIR